MVAPFFLNLSIGVEPTSGLPEGQDLPVSLITPMLLTSTHGCSQISECPGGPFLQTSPS